MLKSILSKLFFLRERYEEISALLAAPNLMENPEKYKELSKEYARIETIVTCYSKHQLIENNIDEVQAMLMDTDEELRSLVNDELHQLNRQKSQYEQELLHLLLPQDPDDKHDIFLEIRAAAGGNESAIFAGDLLRMYSRYAEHKGWKIELISNSVSDQGGFKEVIIRIAGKDVYANLKFESGAHRVQRIPVTEAQGRIHTSTCTVAVLPEVAQIEQEPINPDELRIETFRASGAGGQHVQKTNSAIRITHIPSGLVVECQDERSQHKNRARAMSLLHARLLSFKRKQQQEEQDTKRRNLVGTGDRSERIRTYNFPQGRLTDHRINLTLFKLNDVMEGEINLIILPLQQQYQADLLADLN